MTNGNRENSWHMRKDVQLADIIAMLAIGAALAAWIFALSERVTKNTNGIESHQAVVDVQIEAIKEEDRQLRQEMANNYAEIIRRLERIEDSINLRHNSE